MVKKFVFLLSIIVLLTSCGQKTYEFPYGPSVELEEETPIEHHSKDEVIRDSYYIYKIKLVDYIRFDYTYFPYHSTLHATEIREVVIGYTHFKYKIIECIRGYEYPYKKFLLFSMTKELRDMGYGCAYTSNDECTNLKLGDTITVGLQMRGDYFITKYITDSILSVE